jgi:hypothetical protein
MKQGHAVRQKANVTEDESEWKTRWRQIVAEYDTEGARAQLAEGGKPGWLSGILGRRGRWELAVAWWWATSKCWATDGMGRQGWEHGDL